MRADAGLKNASTFQVISSLVRCLFVGASSATSSALLAVPLTSPAQLAASEARLMSMPGPTTGVPKLSTVAAATFEGFGASDAGGSVTAPPIGGVGGRGEPCGDPACGELGWREPPGEHSPCRVVALGVERRSADAADAHDNALCISPSTCCP